MSISPSKARALCTESEYNLVKWSSPKNVKTLTPAKLKDKIGRTRKLRDKFRDLSNKQRGEARGKRKPTGTRAAKGNERTVQKAELFAQTLERFQKALEKAEKDEAKPAKSSKKKKSSKKRQTDSSPSDKKSAKRQTDFSPSEASRAKSNTASDATRTSKPGASSKTAKSSKQTTAKSKPSTSQKRSAAPAPSSPAAPIPLAAPAHRPLGSSLSLGAAGASNPLTGLFASSMSNQQSRETRRRDKSATTKIGREQSRFAATAREKIQGHVSAQTRRSQAKRDSK